MNFNQSDQYLEETLLQARKHDLPLDYIKNLEFERNKRLAKERELMWRESHPRFYQ